MPARRPERSEALLAELVDALRTTGLPDWYYALCDEFPQRIGDYSPQGDAMRSAWEATGLAYRASGKRAGGGRLGGRDHRLEALMMPARYCGMFDVPVHLVRDGRTGIAVLHIVARDLLVEAGVPPRSPAYPRPWAMSDAEVAAIAQRLADRLVDLARVLDVPA
ncbi:hypothetical protein [Jatrophihabitans fulvus]